MPGKGKDSSGFLEFDGHNYSVSRFDFDLKSIKKSRNQIRLF